MLGSSEPSSDGRRPEKSKFVNTCNLLSRYMKEKGSLRDLNLEIGGKVESLEALVKPGSTHFASASTTVDVASDKGKSKEQHSCMPIDGHNLTSAAKNSQMTIFYSGRVLVFEECPADKAKEVIAFAKKQSSQMSYGNTTVLEKPSTGTSSPREGLPPRPQTNTCTAARGEPKESADLPIARRSSLNRFLEKRKDRAAVRGPYHHQVQEQPASSSSTKDDEHLELRL